VVEEGAERRVILVATLGGGGHLLVGVLAVDEMRARLGEDLYTREYWLVEIPSD
jgi:hypothetical protein